MQFKSVSKRTFDRNLNSGKWQMVGAIRKLDGVELGCLVQTLTTTRGVHNAAGRTFYVEFNGDVK